MNLIRLVAYSPIIVSVLLIFIYLIIRQRYRWAFGDFFQYIIFGGVVSFVCTFVLIMSLTFYYHWDQGPLSLFWYGPLAFSLGELAGFGLYLWVLRNKGTLNKKVNH
jgi:hypothetical protein